MGGSPAWSLAKLTGCAYAAFFFSFMILARSEPLLFSWHGCDTWSHGCEPPDRTLLIVMRVEVLLMIVAAAVNLCGNVSVAWFMPFKELPAEDSNSDQGKRAAIVRSVCSDRDAGFEANIRLLLTHDTRLVVEGDDLLRKLEQLVKRGRGRAGDRAPRVNVRLLTDDELHANRGKNPKNWKLMLAFDELDTNGERPEWMHCIDPNISMTLAEVRAMQRRAEAEDAMLCYAVCASFVPRDMGTAVMCSPQYRAAALEISMNSAAVPRLYTFVTWMFGITAVTDKAMVLNVGRFAEKADRSLYVDYLNGDSAVGDQLVRDGCRVVQHSRPACDTVGVRTYGQVYERYFRWAIMRKNFAPLLFMTEMFFAPSFQVVALSVLARPMAGFWFAVGAALADWALMNYLHSFFRERMRAPTLYDLIVGGAQREYLAWTTFVHACAARTIRWRGKECRVVKRGRNTLIEVE